MLEVTVPYDVVNIADLVVYEWVNLKNYVKDGILKYDLHMMFSRSKLSRIEYSYDISIKNNLKPIQMVRSGYSMTFPNSLHVFSQISL